MRWAWQQEGYGLGNFLMMTPAMRLLSKRTKSRMPVYFDNKPIGTLFTDCPFMEILNRRPRTNPLIASKPPRNHVRVGNIRSYLQACRIQVDRIPNYYIDSDFKYQLDATNPVAVFHGCLGKYWFKQKTVPRETRQYILDELVNRGFTPVLLGDDSDYSRFWNGIKFPETTINLLGKLRLRASVAALNQCRFFISNDTGLAHAASALCKPGLVLWYRTNFHQNKVPFDGIEHCQNHAGDPEVYRTAIDTFLSKQ